MQRVEPSSGIGLGRPVKRVLQGSDRIHSRSRSGGTSRHGTHRTLPAGTRADEAAVLPSPVVVLSARLDRYYDRLRRPPSASSTSRLIAGYRTPLLPAGSRSPHRPGRASPVPAVTFCTFHALYAGEFVAAALQALHRFHGLRPEGPGSALPFPTRRWAR